MKYNVTLNGKVYEVDVERGEAILVNMYDYAPPAPVQSVSPVAAAPAVAVPQAAVTVALTGELISAPMPGNILDVRVKAGDTVKAGQIMIILEAMKMENEILAPRDGTVAQVAVSKGNTVNTGDSLLSLA